MFGSRIKSALFIDFENVGSVCPPDRIQNWIRWIEDGEFDHGRRRRLVEKRVYWNPSHQKHEEAFKRQGFEVVLCEKFQYLKNGADIRIALDVMETIANGSHVHEFILLAQDTDYVPVLQRLEAKGRQSAILVDERQDRIFAIYDLHADVTIPTRIFQEEALTYERRQHPLQETMHALRLRFSGSRQTTASAASVTAVTQSQLAPQPPPRRRSKVDPMVLAVRGVLRVTSLKPNHFTAREDIEQELRKIREFHTRGRGKYFGYEGYQALMREVAKRSDKIRVVDAAFGGVSVRYIPEED